MSDDIAVEEPIKTTRGNKRKALKVTKEMVAPLASVEPLDIKDMILKAEGRGRCHFKRLKYKECPVLSYKGEFQDPTQCIDMKRDTFVREMYRLFKPDFNVTSATYFNLLIDYISWVDRDDNTLIVEKNDYFNNELINAYMKHWAVRVKTNKGTKGSWANAKKAQVFILKKLGRALDAKKLPTISGLKAATKEHKALHIESELKPTLKALMRGFNGLAASFEAGNKPDIHPIFDETLFNKQAERLSLNASSRAARERTFKNCMMHNWQNLLTQQACMICFSFTGMNLKPMLMLERQDVTFKAVQGNCFVLNSVKGRAVYKEIDNAMGFSKYAKEFIERWLKLSAKIAGDAPDAPLFPYIQKDGEITTFIKSNRHPQITINKHLRILGLSELTSSIARKTKLATLMQVTEDVYLVSISGNNAIKTVKRTYSSGSEKDYQGNLAASMDASYDIAKGKTMAEAVSDAKAKYVDVLSEYDYKKVREKAGVTDEATTLVGGRCQNPAKEARDEKILKKKGIEMPAEEKRCTNFLVCFECEFHKLVASVNDIWLMLSFKVTLDEMLQMPAVNSMPKADYDKICVNVDSALVRFKEKSIKNYNKAQEKMKLDSHPLYSTVYSLTDLLEVF
jgi:hypothetical protein|tara:strand:- start:29238 stop:31106 length:1869 start_codon:yes stop_codon:yes gene_type:complete